MCQFFLCSFYYSRTETYTVKFIFDYRCYIETGNDTKGYVSFKPYYLISGESFNALSNGIGGNFKGSINASVFSKSTPKLSFGIADNASIRYAFANFNKTESAQKA